MIVYRGVNEVMAAFARENNKGGAHHFDKGQSEQFYEGHSKAQKRAMRRRRAKVQKLARIKQSWGTTC